MRTIMLNLREDEVLTVIDALDLQRAELDPFVPANGPRAGHLKDLADFLQELLHPETFPDGHPAQVRARALQPQPEAREVDNTGDYLPPQPEVREEAYEIGTPREFAERLAWMAVNGKLDLDQWENHIKFRDAALSRLAAKEGQGERALREALEGLLRANRECRKPDIHRESARDLMRNAEAAALAALGQSAVEESHDAS